MSRYSTSPIAPPLFDPKKPDRELFDTLAEKQASQLGNVGSSQLRRFFGEIKELYRRFESRTAGMSTQEERAAYYRASIEPLFKMIRSKVSYAQRPAGQSSLAPDFAAMLRDGIGKVDDHEQFRRFVMHIEAVVGFLYGSGKVNK